MNYEIKNVLGKLPKAKTNLSKKHQLKLSLISELNDKANNFDDLGGDIDDATVQAYDLSFELMRVIEIALSKTEQFNSVREELKAIMKDFETLSDELGVSPLSVDDYQTGTIALSHADEILENLKPLEKIKEAIKTI